MMYFMIAFGGAFGALSRYGMTRWINTTWHHHFPLATLLVNVLGCVLMGIAFVIVSERMPSLEPYRPLVMVGFLGAFTTFSTFSLEIVSLINMQAWLSAISYLLLSCILGVVGLAVGIAVTRVF
ncbi:fluoride efflux transporter CrcB [Marinomonas sp. M1K-6]|uniref:Fluoride-specific ion channel FluC n=1 Tax=Marinomonas profundi TaxID=2726122 RepID=A0A847R022_9GAMM|nr:fluoride efflux transporter CrcB [Marinomonas profundi]NLQ16695.1 fluoride efflux transporter CrcB [Marinomonas profundi]UDV03729.1 fluoride efflux transporter CrcB [Marinomonas profundi]